MTTLTFTKEELIAIRILVGKNRDSAKLQKDTKISYIESINFGNKIDRMIESKEKDEWLEKQKEIYNISFDYDSQEMVITDNQNNVEYRIHRNLVVDDKVAQYHIVNAEDEADELESYMIPEARSDYEKNLMREDLETLRECEDEFAIGYYDTNGFVSKESNIEEFNKICLEIIESYQELCYSVKVTDIKWDFDNDEVTLETEKHYWILPTDLEANTLDKAKEEIEELIADKLSDDEGYCHNGFKIEIKEPFDKSLAEYLKDNSCL